MNERGPGERGGCGERAHSDTWLGARHQRWTGRSVQGRLGTGDLGSQMDRCGDSAQARALSQAWPHSPALIPAGSWVAAEAAGGSPWGLEGGPGTVDPSPRAPGGERGCRI